MTDFSYQLYSSRKFGPLETTLAMLAREGYTQVEGYGPLYEDAAATRKLLDANALAMPTGHFSLDLVEKEPEKALQIAKTLGVKKVYVPHLMPADRPTDGDGWRAFGKRLIAAGAPIRAAGLGYGWHNHDFELVACSDGTVPLDAITEAGDIELELDIAWVVRGGADPLAYIAKYADRITAAHIKDIAPKGEKTDEDGWADPGTGVMDWPAIMAALRKTKVQYFVMEHDNPSDDKRFAKNAITSARKF